MLQKIALSAAAAALSVTILAAPTLRTIQPERRVVVKAGLPIDTRNLVFQPFTMPPQPLEVENVMFAPWRTLPGEQNTLPLGETMPYVRTTAKSYWPGIGATGWVPADPTLAVGPTAVVSTVNVALQFFSKTGTPLGPGSGGNPTASATLNTFFSGVATTSFIFDPKCNYDRQSGRFIVVALEQKNPSNSTTPPYDGISGVLVAISDDSDPVGTWYRYRIDTQYLVRDAGNNITAAYWMDYPGLGFNKDGIFVVGNMFRSFRVTGDTSPSFRGAMFVTFPKAPALSNQAITVSYLNDTSGGSVQGADVSDATTNRMYGISDFNSATFRLYAISNILTAPVLNTQNIAVPGYAYPTVDAPTNPGLLDSLDGRVYNASFRAGRLVTTHTTAASASDTVNRVRWYEFATNDFPSGAPSLIQSGQVLPPSGSGQHFHMCGISRNAYKDISVIFTRSSSTITADIMTAGRKNTDALGTMGTPTLLESSSGTYGVANSTSRWGDYFAVVVDPSDETTFYGIAMRTTGGSWATSIWSWQVSAPSTLSACTVPLPSINGGSTMLGTVTLSGPAPIGGLVVNLVSSNPSVASVPASVTVPEDATSANFLVSTNSIQPPDVPVTVTASMNGVNRPANFNVLWTTATIVPSAASTLDTLVSGGVPELALSDDLYMVTSRSGVASGTFQSDFSATAPISNPSGWTPSIELKLNGPAIGFATLWLFNYGTGQWDPVLKRYLSSTDQIIPITIVGPANYINTTSRLMQFRLTAKPKTSVGTYTLSVDQVKWVINR